MPRGEASAIADEFESSLRRRPPEDFAELVVEPEFIDLIAPSGSTYVVTRFARQVDDQDVLRVAVVVEERGRWQPFPVARTFFHPRPPRGSVISKSSFRFEDWGFLNLYWRRVEVSGLHAERHLGSSLQKFQVVGALATLVVLVGASVADIASQGAQRVSFWAWVASSVAGAVLAMALVVVTLAARKGRVTRALSAVPRSWTPWQVSIDRDLDDPND